MLLYYIGIKENNGIGGQTILRVEDTDGRTGGIEISPRNDIVNHSPDGLNWGYGGSGAAQAALAILVDFLNDDETALKLYQKFKWDFIAKQGDELKITKNEIDEWLLKNKIF